MATALSFADEMAAALPNGMELPDALRDLFVFLEADSFVRPFKNGKGRYALLYPHEWQRGLSLVSFQPSEPGFARGWSGSDDPMITSRLAEFCRTGGDGSHAALWRDDEGRLRVVHLGSGSGSTWMGVISDSIVDFLRFLAIGYDEACWPEQFNQTPQQVAAARMFRAEDERPPVPPLAYRAYLMRRHGVSIPAVGAEVVGAVSEMGTISTDPFWRWMTALQAKRDQK